MPRAPKQCGGCSSRVVARTYCDACQERRQWEGAGHGATWAEQKLRAQVMDEEPTCRDCGAASEEAGHIVARALGGKYVRENLKGQCRSCNLAQMIADRTPEELDDLPPF